MKKRNRGILAAVLTVMMTISSALPMQVKADTAEANQPTGEITIEQESTGKLLKTYEETDKPLTVDGQTGDEGTVFNEVKFDTNGSTASGEKAAVVSFISKDYRKGIYSTKWIDGAVSDVVRVKADDGIGGWESMRLVPNGDGTISFADSYFGEPITVEEQDGAPVLKCHGTSVEEKDKFILHVDEAYQPDVVTDVEVTERTQDTLTLHWENPSASLYSGIQVSYQAENEVAPTVVTMSAIQIAQESYTVENLTPGTLYSFKIKTTLGKGADERFSEESAEVQEKTRTGVRPATPGDVTLTEQGDTYILNWTAAANAKQYQIERAPSLFGNYEKLSNVAIIGNRAIIPAAKDHIYENYYRIVAVNGEEFSEPSEAVSLEKNLFGDHTIIFAPTDDPQQINETVQKIFIAQNDYANDAQFNSENWSIYYKPGDYKNTECVPVGFYTQVAGLGKLPTDVELNNIEVPAYLDGGASGDYWGGDGSFRNATCNFWRSAENLAVTGTEDASVVDKVAPQSQNNGKSYLNWSVAQAAPIRRVYSTRPVKYDCDWGWASGGYTADCMFIGVDKDGNGAGTASGQQYYTRNSEITGNAFGTTLNQFCQGVLAKNLPTDANYETMFADAFKPLESKEGYTNWAIPGQDDSQQVITSISKTDEISEKPFLYLNDEGEYCVFVPAVQKDRAGVSWGEGKANDGMGEGESLPLSAFYIAKPTDSAAEINAQIAAGKNIYFTPGIYHAETPIVVNHADTILLGSGMASIIPDNGEAAVETQDLDGIRICGLIFDAGKSSKYLLRVGSEKTDVSHVSAPIILQDLFFRVGGTTKELTKADDALEINANDVLCDHFWIWRADHGAGVEWYGNESRHGIIVNGDRVICYALFDEHFQQNDVLWNGENGKTYFLQNEKCYDPISQEAWMSHNGKVNGYAAYKVNNQVKHHYAVGLGIYNVFIYTGPTYDAKEVSISMENAVEVPNASDVRIENACIQTFANDDGQYESIDHLINGVGPGVSSGNDPATGRTGSGWSRKFLLNYCDGTATFGKANEKFAGKNKGIMTVTGVKAPEDETEQPSEPRNPQQPEKPGENQNNTENPGNPGNSGNQNPPETQIPDNPPEDKSDDQNRIDISGTRTKNEIYAVVDKKTLQKLLEQKKADEVVSIQINDENGKLICTLQAKTGDLKQPGSLTVYRKAAGTKTYVLMQKKQVKVKKDGSLSITVQDIKGKYVLKNAKEAQKINAQIYKTMKFASANGKLRKGNSKKLRFAADMNRDNIQNIIYTSSDKSKVSVSKTGQVKAKKTGTVTIKAKITLKNGKIIDTKTKMSVK